MVTVLAFFSLGAFLRLFLFPDQVLLNDEWHPLYYVSDKSFSFVFTHVSMGANSIPMNLYCWFLLKTTGLSEVLLRLPSLIAGMAGLLIFPLFLRRILNRRVAIIFAFLCAISPSLVYYSRVFRPYSMIAFLSFLSILSLYLWVVGGRARYALLYIVTGVLTVYLHIYAVVIILAPLCFIFLARLNDKWSHVFDAEEKQVIGIPALVKAAAVIALLLGVLYVPAWMDCPLWRGVLANGSISPRTVINYLCLLSGTANKPIVCVFIGLLFCGVFCLLRKKPVFGGILFSVIIFYVLLLGLSRPAGIHAAIVAARYSISVFPVCFVFVACGTDHVLSFVPLDGVGARQRFFRFSGDVPAAVFLLILFFTGPLKDLYVEPNNFTNHSAFQESYEPLSWDTSFACEVYPMLRLDKRRIPPFYSLISGEPDGTSTIIEYPMFIGDYFNLYYYYQHFHGKKILIGYYPCFILEKGLKRTFVHGDNITCDALSAIQDTSKLKFRNMIDMRDIEAIRASRAGYIILHKNPMHEIFPDAPAHEYDLLISISLGRAYLKHFGPPFFEDKDLIVFKLLPTKNLHRE